MGNYDLHIKDLNKYFKIKNGNVQVLKNINLDVKEGEFISIVGHSGCGKSTLLKVIAGLTDYDSGEVKIGNKELHQSDASIGMVFQDHRLLPWMTVEENIGFGLYGYSIKDKQELVREHIELVGLKGFEKAYPHQLSGGMAQRTAIARALIHRPKILLLDEPFGALDALTRIQLQEETLKIWEKEKTTMILVTHDIDEAIYLSNRVVIASNRPFHIRDIFQVDLSRYRQRTDSDFMTLKAKIMEEFFNIKKVESEYII